MTASPDIILQTVYAGKTGLASAISERG